MYKKGDYVRITHKEYISQAGESLYKTLNCVLKDAMYCNLSETTRSQMIHDGFVVLNSAVFRGRRIYYLTCHRAYDCANQTVYYPYILVYEEGLTPYTKTKKKKPSEKLSIKYVI